MKKKVMMMVLCAVMMCSMAACGSGSVNKDTAPAANTEAGTENLGENTQIANPFIDYESAEEAAKAIGYDFVVPEEVNGSKSVIYQTCLTDFVQAIYQDANEENVAIIRKGEGSDDISGDYGEYSESNEVTVNDVTVTMKGEAGKVVLATWTAGDYTYSITSNEMTQDEMTELVSEVQ